MYEPTHNSCVAEVCQSVSEVSFAIFTGSSLPGKTVIDSFPLLFMVMLTFTAAQNILGERGAGCGSCVNHVNYMDNCDLKQVVSSVYLVGGLSSMGLPSIFGVGLGSRCRLVL